MEDTTTKKPFGLDRWLVDIQMVGLRSLTKGRDLDDARIIELVTNWYIVHQDEWPRFQRLWNSNANMTRLRIEAMTLFREVLEA